MKVTTRIRLDGWHKKAFAEWNFRNLRARQAYDENPNSTHQQKTDYTGR